MTAAPLVKLLGLVLVSKSQSKGRLKGTKSQIKGNKEKCSILVMHIKFVQVDWKHDMLRS